MYSPIFSSAQETFAIFAISVKHELNTLKIKRSKQTTRSRKIIEERFDKFPFYEGNPRLKWDGKKGFKLEGKAIQVSIKFLNDKKY